MGLYEDLLQNRNAKLIAGGAAQNTARGAAVCSLPLHPYQRFPPIPISPTSLTCALLALVIVVLPPPFLCDLHRLRRRGQVRGLPAHEEQRSGRALRVPRRQDAPDGPMRRDHHGPRPEHVHAPCRRERVQDRAPQESRDMVASREGGRLLRRRIPPDGVRARHHGSGGARGREQQDF